MASPCQLLIDDVDETEAQQLFAIAIAEVKRIEAKFSRYRDDNVIANINNAYGKQITLDSETVKLINLAQLCFQLSDGMFDISAGILGKLWHFKDQTTLPNHNEIIAILKHIGWQKALWQPPHLTLPIGMQIDLGGIGKEYAVDRVAYLLGQQTTHAFLVNLGGDLFSNKARGNGEGWQVAIENPYCLEQGEKTIELRQGGVASSGNSQRFIDINGERYSHILNPKTGNPVLGGPNQVTVYAQNCVQAGILATIALLQGEDAAAFLTQQDCQYWCY